MGPHRCVLWPPVLILPRDEPSPEVQEPPHPEPEQQCQGGSQLERLSKRQIRLSSHNSCWNLSFSHSFVVNGLSGKSVWKGFGELVAAPHPGATQHCLPSLFPQPLAGLPPQFLLHCSLGKFFTQISCWNIWVFFLFLLPSDLFLLILFPCSWEQVASFPSGALPQGEAMAVSVPVPHPGHPTSATLTLPMALVTLVLCPPCFGVPVPIRSCPTAPSPFVSSAVPWAAGGCGCSQPCTCLFNKALSLLSACCVLLPEQWQCGPSRVGGQEPGRGGSAFLWGPFPVHGGSEPPVSPCACLSILSLPQFPAAGNIRSTLAGYC